MSIIKNTLKRVVPRVVLKKAWGLFKKIRISVVDPILFPEHHVGESEFYLYRKGFPFHENNVNISSTSNDRVKSYMQQWYDWTQEEFILDFKQAVVIEPDHGWAITSKGKLVYYSLGISRTWFLPKPSIREYKSRTNVKKVSSVVSFRDTGEENYFHFFNDVLAKYFFLLSKNVDLRDRYFIISKKLYDKPYFQWYIKNATWTSSINWLVQDREYIETSSAIFCKPITHNKSFLDAVFNPVLKIVPSSRKLFVDRGRSRMRHITNSAEVHEVFRKNGFEIVDTDNLSLDQQREIFSGASFIAGVHGAALTNMYFSSQCRVLEIFPPPEDGYLPFHYIMTADLKGFPYDAIIGEGARLNLSGGFDVNVNELESVLRRMIAR